MMPYIKLCGTGILEVYRMTSNYEKLKIYGRHHTNPNTDLRKKRN
jgi:hypothetical protein